VSALASDTEPKSDDIRVALVACASDEGAYIRDWLAHHYVVGVRDFFVGVNRSSDATAEILDTVQLADCTVRWDSFDWIDLVDTAGLKEGSPMQPLIYAWYLDHIRSTRHDISHVLFLDIDEFWFSRSLDQTLDDYVALSGNPDAISFHWYCIYGEDRAFLPPFAASAGSISEGVKSLVKVSAAAPLRRLTAHQPVFAAEARYILPGGDPYRRRFGGCWPADQAFADDALVLHRMSRSHEEFKALLQRGRPRSKARYKTNRRPFLDIPPVNDLGLRAETLSAHSRAVEDISRTMGADALVEAEQDRILRAAAAFPVSNRQYFFEDLIGAHDAMRLAGEGPRLPEVIAGLLPLSKRERSLLNQFLDAAADTRPRNVRRIRRLLAANAKG